METVDKIVGAKRDDGNRPLEPFTIKSAKVTIKGKDK
jgi:hypothetical protein